MGAATLTLCACRFSFFGQILLPVRLEKVHVGLAWTAAGLQACGTDCRKGESRKVTVYKPSGRLRAHDQLVFDLPFSAASQQELEAYLRVGGLGPSFLLSRRFSAYCLSANAVFGTNNNQA